MAWETRHARLLLQRSKRVYALSHAHASSRHDTYRPEQRLHFGVEGCILVHSILCIFGFAESAVHRSCILCMMRQER